MNDLAKPLSSSPLDLILEKKQFLMSLLKVYWFTTYSFLITLFQIGFLFHNYLGTLILNILFIINQVFTFVIIFLLKTNENSLLLSKILSTDRYRSLTFSVLYLADLIVCLVLYNNSFTSYDPYEKFFASLITLINLIRIVILIIAGFLKLKEIEKSE